MSDDRDIQTFILAAPREMTFSVLERVIQEQFGDDCGWSRSRITAFWNAQHPVKKGVRSRVCDDAELRRFVDDRLSRLTLDEVRCAAIEAFGADRVPSRSALHRYWQWARRARA
ncbi:hypothetical protein [Roseomonas genomospecies 6]|uniref:Uncharacterized protein n=1 Tax=Roseomonas genomospecies 6 TaxID=214106 RepID=A0A9W7TZW8_9PROT|nr:hypothetical protein [Roseomonas genomospecies 6]KAA0683347.1 hypothetical protein DS843_02835 [Roseomonas genomospecies 6]